MTRRRGALRLDLTTPGLLGLPLAWLVVFFVVPIAIVAAYSFDVYSLFPGAARLHARGLARVRARRRCTSGSSGSPCRCR